MYCAEAIQAKNTLLSRYNAAVHASFLTRHMYEIYNGHI